MIAVNLEPKSWDAILTEKHGTFNLLDCLLAPFDAKTDCFEAIPQLTENFVTF